jgi:hypothetical protein
VCKWVFLYPFLTFWHRWWLQVFIYCLCVFLWVDLISTLDAAWSKGHKLISWRNYNIHCIAAHKCGRRVDGAAHSCCFIVLLVLLVDRFLTWTECSFSLSNKRRQESNLWFLDSKKFVNSNKSHCFMHLNVFLEGIHRFHQTVEGVHGTKKGLWTPDLTLLHKLIRPPWFQEVKVKVIPWHGCAVTGGRRMYDSNRFATWVQEGGGRSVPRPGRFACGKEPMSIVRKAEWASGPIWREWKILPTPGFDSWTVQPVASRFTDHTIPVAILFVHVSSFVLGRWHCSILAVVSDVCDFDCCTVLARLSRGGPSAVRSAQSFRSSGLCLCEAVIGKRTAKSSIRIAATTHKFVLLSYWYYALVPWVS